MIRLNYLISLEYYMIVALARSPAELQGDIGQSLKTLWRIAWTLQLFLWHLFITEFPNFLLFRRGKEGKPERAYMYILSLTCDTSIGLGQTAAASS
jgi:hypothetical protein